MAHLYVLSIDKQNKNSVYCGVSPVEVLSQNRGKQKIKAKFMPPTMTKLNDTDVFLPLVIGKMKLMYLGTF